MSQKIVISKPGDDAVTETNPDNLIFSSDYNTLKYYASGSVVVNYVDNNTVYTVTVAHNLGYIPFFTAFVNVGGTSYSIVPLNGTTAAGLFFCNVYADATNLYFLVQQNQGSGLPGTQDFYYKLFKNNTGF